MGERLGRPRPGSYRGGYQAADRCGCHTNQGRRQDVALQLGHNELRPQQDQHGQQGRERPQRTQLDQDETKRIERAPTQGSQHAELTPPPPHGRETRLHREQRAKRRGLGQEREGLCGHGAVELDDHALFGPDLGRRITRAGQLQLKRHRLGAAAADQVDLEPRLVADLHRHLLQAALGPIEVRGQGTNPDANAADGSPRILALKSGSIHQPAGAREVRQKKGRAGDVAAYRSIGPQDSSVAKGDLRRGICLHASSRQRVESRQAGRLIRADHLPSPVARDAAVIARLDRAIPARARFRRNPQLIRAATQKREVRVGVDRRIGGDAQGLKSAVPQPFVGSLADPPDRPEVDVAADRLQVRLVQIVGGEGARGQRHCVGREWAERRWCRHRYDGPRRDVGGKVRAHK